MILTKENTSWLADKIDEAIKLKGLLELVDGYAAKVILQVIDSKIDDKVEIADELKGKFNALVQFAKDKDYAKVEEVSIEILDSLIDIPGIDNDSEALLFEGAVKMVIGAIQSWLNK